jgi:hypothetical protein
VQLAIPGVVRTKSIAQHLPPVQSNMEIVGNAGQRSTAGHAHASYFQQKIKDS